MRRRRSTQPHVCSVNEDALWWSQEGLRSMPLCLLMHAQAHAVSEQAALAVGCAETVAQQRGGGRKTCTAHIHMYNRVVTDSVRQEARHTAPLACNTSRQETQECTYTLRCAAPFAGLCKLFQFQACHISSYVYISYISVHFFRFGYLPN